MTSRLVAISWALGSALSLPLAAAPLDPPAGFRDLAPHPFEVGHFFGVAAGSPLWETRDAGVTWQRAGTGAESVEAAVFGSDGTAWAAVRFGGMLKRAAGEADWTSVADATEFSPEARDTEQPWSPGLIVDPRAGERLYRVRQFDVWRSEDGGRSWAQLFAATNAVAGLSLAPGPAGSLWLATVGEGGGLFSSRDHGSLWTGVPGPGGGAFPDGVQAVVAPAPEVFVVLAGDGNLLRSLDGGETWNELAAPGDATLSRRAVTLGRGREPSLFLLAGCGFFVSRDRGTTWSRRADTFICGAPDLRVAPGGLVLAAVGSWIGVGTQLGLQWRFSQAAADPGTPKIDPFDPKNGLALAGPGLFRTRDGGRTWYWRGESELRDDLGESIVTFVDGVFDAFRRGRLWAASPVGVLSSSDDGVSWHRATSMDARVLRQLGRRTWLVGGCGMRRSDDGGHVWQQVQPCRIGTPGEHATDGERIILRIVDDPRRPGGLIASVSDRPYSTSGGNSSIEYRLASRDGGRTWKRVPDFDP